MTHEQLGVVKGALPALLITLIYLSTGYYLAQHGTALHTDVRVVFGIIMFPLLYCIGHIGNKRFKNNSVIGGSAYDTPESIVALDKAVLQNTLEQTVFALGTYTMCSAVLPDLSTTLLPILATLFVIGRIFFIARYAHGAHGRAFGFGLTFYPTVLTLFGTTLFALFV